MKKKGTSIDNPWWKVNNWRMRGVWGMHSLYIIMEGKCSEISLSATKVAAGKTTFHHHNLFPFKLLNKKTKKTKVADTIQHGHSSIWWPYRLPWRWSHHETQQLYKLMPCIQLPDFFFLSCMHANKLFSKSEAQPGHSCFFNWFRFFGFSFF